MLGGREAYRDFAAPSLDQIIHLFSFAPPHAKRLEPFQLLQVGQPGGRMAECRSQRLLETSLKLDRTVIVKIHFQLLLPPVPLTMPFFEPSPQSLFRIGGTVAPQHRDGVDHNFGIGVVQKLDRQLFQLRTYVKLTDCSENVGIASAILFSFRRHRAPDQLHASRRVNAKSVRQQPRLFITGHIADSVIEQRSDTRKYVWRTVSFYQRAVNLRILTLLKIVNED